MSGVEFGLLTLGEAADELSVDRFVIGTIVDRKRLPYREVGKAKLIDRDTLEVIRDALRPVEPAGRGERVPA